MVQELTDRDTELVYQYLTDSVKTGIDYEAFERARASWVESRPEDLETLREAHMDGDVSFRWTNITVEFAVDGESANTDQPFSYAGDAGEEVDRLAVEFAPVFADAVRDEVRTMQEATIYSPREFVALVLKEAPDVTEETASELMDISLGNFRGKKGDVSTKHDQAQDTVQITRLIQS